MSDFGNEVSIKYVSFCKTYFLKDFALRNNSRKTPQGEKLYHELHFPREDAVL